MSADGARQRPLFRVPAASLSDRLDQACRAYRKRIARCRTENQRNRVHIAIENYMTPLEVRHFDAALAAEPADSPSRRWIAGLNAFMPTRRIRPAEFERRGLVKGASLYTAGVGSPQQKTLVLAFGGHFHRLMVPTPSVLDCLDPALFDVVLLRDFSRTFFTGGIPGLGADFFTALANLRRHIDPRAYRSSIALGTSAGGMPALLAALLLRLPRGISVGGMDFAHFADKLGGWGVSPKPYAELLASRPEPFPDLLLVYCAGHAIDAAAALALHSGVPSRLLEIKSCKGHGVFPTKLRQGRLPSFLSKLLGPQRVRERVSTIDRAPEELRG
jgi:hypothetical protein